MSKFKSCIFFMADGARSDVFEELLNKGDLPNISRFIVDKGSFNTAVTVFPSTTGPAYTPFILGKFPGRCNLPGIRWFDREIYAKSLFSPYRFRSYIGIETFFMNQDIYRDTPTLFEIFPGSVSILNELSRGVGIRGDKTKLVRIYYKMKSHFTNRCDEVDMAARRILLKSVSNIPRFIYVVFLGIDTYSHLNHPFHKTVISSYKRIDETVGKVCETLTAKGAIEDTLLILGSDHGLSPIHSHFDSIEFMERQGFKTFHYPNVHKHFRNADAANMVSGNSMTHLYIKNQEGWHKKTTFDELSNLVDSLIERKEIDIIAGFDQNGVVRIKSEKGEAVAEQDENGSINYNRISGDPFGYNGMPKNMTKEGALKYSYKTDYPDAIVQLIQILESPRSGDLVVSANPGFDLRAKYEKPEHRSSHGALYKEHMLVPLAISYKISKKYIRTADIYPTILKLLGKTQPVGIDGVSLV